MECWKNNFNLVERDGILNKAHSYTSRKCIRVRAIVHANAASLCAAVSLQSAYKLHIQFPNVHLRTQKIKDLAMFHYCRNTSGRHADAYVRVRILLPKVYLSIDVDHGLSIRLALSNIPIVYFRTFASAEVSRTYLFLSM